MIHYFKVMAHFYKMVLFDDGKEWEEYSRQYPDRVSKAVADIEDRLKDGKSPIECFSEGVEYVRRSLTGRHRQYLIVRRLIYLLTGKEKSRVLDFGCGVGNAGMLFAHAGFDVDLLDVEGVITDFLKWRVDRHFLKCRMNQDSPLGRYDLVVMFNVLEHLERPLAVLKRITKSLDAGGYFLFSFSTAFSGLDIVSQSTFDKKLMPYILDKYVAVNKPDLEWGAKSKDVYFPQMLYRKRGGHKKFLDRWASVRFT